MAQTTTGRYRAFLSYSHQDAEWAKWLHSALEHYRVDKDLIGRVTSAGPVPKTLQPIFRDREDFSADHSLSAQTLEALQASDFLIVICSPTAAKSTSVNKEILRFKQISRGDRVIAIIVDGEPGDAERECFPPAIRLKITPNVHLVADARPSGDGKEIAKQRVISGLLGLRLGQIARRVKRARRKRTRFWAALAAIFLLLAATSAGSAFYVWQQLWQSYAVLGDGFNAQGQVAVATDQETKDAFSERFTGSLASSASNPTRSPGRQLQN